MRIWQNWFRPPCPDQGMTIRIGSLNTSGPCCGRPLRFRNHKLGQCATYLPASQLSSIALSQPSNRLSSRSVMIATLNSNLASPPTFGGPERFSLTSMGLREAGWHAPGRKRALQSTQLPRLSSGCFPDIASNRSLMSSGRSDSNPCRFPVRGCSNSSVDA